MKQVSKLDDSLQYVGKEIELHLDDMLKTLQRAFEIMTGIQVDISESEFWKERIRRKLVLMAKIAYVRERMTLFDYIAKDAPDFIETADPNNIL